MIQQKISHISMDVFKLHNQKFVLKYIDNDKSSKLKLQT